MPPYTDPTAINTEAAASLLGSTGSGKAGGLKGLLGKGGGLKGAGASMLGYLIMQRLMGLPSEVGERNLRREGIQAQASMISPENMVAQAALPQAKEEESMARQALMSQLSGGVIGPQLTRGERLVGG